MQAIGVFGGSFDPVHNGHLRMALELAETLGFDQMHLLPAYRSPLKDTAQASGDQRLQMVELAVDNCAALAVDAREILSGQATFTYDTLAQWRAEVGPDASLCWVMGTDSLLNFDRWHRWQDFLALANIIVVARPGFSLPEGGVLADWLIQNQVSAEQVVEQAQGGVALLQQRLLPISATDIRAAIAAGHSAQFLLPESVWNYICEYRLYQSQG